MKFDPQAMQSLADGFAAIAKQFKVPGDFPLQVHKEAYFATEPVPVSKEPASMEGRVDATNIPLVTLDPASSTDLDQAFALTRDGEWIVLHYALADVGAFVMEGGSIEREAWNRGMTLYGLPRKVPLYPTCISQNAASLLPDGPRPAFMATVAISPVGEIQLRSLERVLCSSRAKLAYESVQVTQIPHLNDFANRMWDNENARGSIRVEFPQQIVVADSNSPGGVRLDLRAPRFSESVNATLSLAVNMAIGAMMKTRKVGLFRVMDDPSLQSMFRLRSTAHAMGIVWLPSETLRDLQRRLDKSNLVHQRFLMDVRRSGGRAGYACYSDDPLPWHSALAATYVHATAPMRRLADRYVLELAWHLMSEQPLPAELLEKLEKLPMAMAKAEGRVGQVDRAVIDLLEAVSLQHRVGEILEAEVIDDQTGMVQTRDSAIHARATQLRQKKMGELVRVQIESVDIKNRKVVLNALE